MAAAADGNRFDVIIAGGGPAGLSAALVLARCCRRVVVCDAGRPRNRWSSAVHNLIGCDRIGPATLLRRARQQVRRYKAQLVRSPVIAATRRRDGFEARLADHRRLRGRVLLLATGIRDAAPALPALERWTGRGVYYCAYCDAYEVREQPLIALGHGSSGAELALALRTWSREVVYCTNDRRRPAERICARLRDAGIAVHSRRIVGLRGAHHLEAVELEDGTCLPCRGLFIHEGYEQLSSTLGS